MSRQGRFIVRNIFIGVLFIITVLITVPISTYIYFAKDITTKEAIMNKNDTGVLLLDRNNIPFFSFYQAKQKEFIPLYQIPTYVQQAAIASEDREYYQHQGFSVKGIIRAALFNILNKDISQGGSTITQQLVKNALLTPQKSFLRKYQEIILAYEIERRFTKKEILEMYLNSVYFGEGSFGINEAAEAYFGKPIQRITLAESALIIGILPSPSRFSPISGNRKQALVNQKIVLTKMREQGYITQSQEEDAKKQSLFFYSSSEKLNSTAPHFALMVRDELIQNFGEENIARSGMRVKTSIDLTLQKYVEESVSQHVKELKSNNVSNGSAVILDPKTGQILALVGSKDWYDSEFGKVNMSTALRQPGSSFKPIVYAKALEDRSITTATLLKDSPTTFPGNYRPMDYDRKYRGLVTTRRALANSLNIPSVEVMTKVGVSGALEMADRLGISTLENPDDYGLSLVLGAGEVKLIEMAGAYAVFANQGRYNKPSSILKIVSKDNTVIYTQESQQTQVIEPEVAYLISSILSDNNARTEIFGNTLTIPRPAAVKTGTTENYRDALTIGYTPSVVVAVWVGNNNGETMDQVAGSLGAAPIWKDLMIHYLKDAPIEEFAPPANLIKLSMCRNNSYYNEYFIAGTQPAYPCVLKPTVVPVITLPTLPSTAKLLPNGLKKNGKKFNSN